MPVAKVGEAAPDFDLPCVMAADAAPRPVRRSDYAGRWLMLVFYPGDFTFVCPTELAALSARHADFARRDCSLLGISADPIEMHRQWLAAPPAEGGLGPLQFPLASDPAGEAARAYGVWAEARQVSNRGLFLIDPAGVLQYAVVHNLNVGRNPDEVLRVLDALQTGGLCPASWTSADGTIDLEKALRVGTVLGSYRIRAKLGSGTFGTVFSAWDLRLERTVALKVLKRTSAESHEAILIESRAAARLNHPNVCTVYAVEETDGLPMIVMEYVDGRLLSDMIGEGLDRRRAVGLAAQIAAGLAAAHAAGIVHGDLKPANVIVTEDGAAKLLDFGLATAQRDAPPEGGARARQASPAAEDVEQSAGGIEPTMEYYSSSSDRPGLIRGSLAYMAPEQSQGLPPTPAADVFSFGLTLAEMLTGKRVHSEQSPSKLLLRLQDTKLGEKVASRVDAAYRDTIAAMLAHDPLQRPPMAEVARQLAADGPT